ncbi:unnamed protein product [Calypogeia fissa]
MSTEVLDRGSRASRGKRMSKLLDEEAEADDEFWNQDAFKDAADDNEYAEEDEEADVFDSDFDEDEPDEEEEEQDDDERRPTKKRKLPPGSKHEKRKEEKKKKKQEKKEKKEASKKSKSFQKDKVSFEMHTPVGDTSQAVPSLPIVSQMSQFQENGETIQDADGEPVSIRKSTRTAVVIKQAEREAHQAALQALSRPIKKKKEEERKISQEEMLLEAAQTEIQNLQALEVMLAREEEVKRKAVIQKAFYAGPQIRFHSRDGKNVLEFTKVHDLPQVFSSSPLPYPKKAICVITGLPAKYRDPKTGLAYATKEAFKAIREKFNKREPHRRKDPLEASHQRKRTKVERERLGTGGHRTVTKLKYKKVISMVASDDAVKPTEPDVQNTERSTQPDIEDPVDLNFSSGVIAAKNSIDSLRISSNLMAHDLSLLDMPEAFVETNEADFMLDDLEVSNPSTLE